MKTTKEIGDYGENIATDFLVEKGYSILERNYRYGRAEVDIIAQIDSTIVFVEVKLRNRIDFGSPEDAVSIKKQKLMVTAANQFLADMDHEGPLRFDIISIVSADLESYAIKHFEDAFFPQWTL